MTGFAGAVIKAFLRCIHLYPIASGIVTQQVSDIVLIIFSIVPQTHPSALHHLYYTNSRKAWHMSSCERDISNGEHNISATVNERVTVCVLALHTEAWHCR